MNQGICFERLVVRWGDLEPDQYVITPDGKLWRLVEGRGGAWRVRAPDESEVIWAAQDPAREVPVAELYPADAVQMLRERIGAHTIAFKRNEAGFWVTCPWRDALPGNETIGVYYAHLKEMHGLKPHERGSLPTYEELKRFHDEHHTEGIRHAVPHIHATTWRS